jgi:glycerol 2-dehydrogenase (NADP+)
VGEGIKDSGVPREQIWITTKLDNPWHKRVEEGITSSLKSLGVDYVDLYLMVSLQTPSFMNKH